MAKQNEGGATTDTKAEGDAQLKADAAPEAWAPKVGAPITVFVLGAGPRGIRCKGICTKVHSDGKVDAKVTLPVGSESAVHGIGPAGESRFGDGYAAP